MNQNSLENIKYYIYIKVNNNTISFIKSKKEIKDLQQILTSSKVLANNNNNIILNDNDNDNIIEIIKDKYDDKNLNKVCYRLLKETSDDYKNKVLPYIKKNYKDNVKWIHNILYNNTEKNKIFFKSDEFIILRDLMFQESDHTTFYLLSIPYQNIWSIRNLTGEQLPLLKKMKNECIKYAQKYNITEDQLYFFFNYHPSYYHIHLHCCLIGHKELSPKFYRCKMLDKIIENITNDSEYYQKTDIYFEIPENHNIAKILKKK